MFGNIDLGVREIGLCNGHTGSDYENCSKVHYADELAWFIANYPDKYMDTSIDNIFNINRSKTTIYDNQYGMKQGSLNGLAEIYFNTAMCMHHSSANLVHDGFQEKITNIIDIESPGIFTIYKYTGRQGSKLSYDKETVDLTNEESARNFWVNRMKLSAETFDFNKVKSDFTAFAYLDYCATASREYNPEKSITDYELTMYYRWGRVSEQFAIRNYMKATGLLDSTYMWNLDDLDGGKYHETVSNDVANLLEEVTLNKIEITNTETGEEIVPVAEEKDGKIYVGPFKASFTGGTPVILFNGEETTWFTKKENETYEKQSKELTSGKEFYIEIDNDTDLETVEVTLRLDWKKYKSRLLLATNKTNKGQNIMYHGGTEETGSEKINWEVELIRTVDLTVKKYDENGTTLSTSGLQFAVYEEVTNASGNTTQNYVGVLETTTNSNTTDILKLKTDTKYTLKETSNPKYGYKNAKMTDAKFEGNTGEILSKSARQITFTLTADSVLKINNTPELGSLIIDKTDEAGSTKLEGVEFAIYKAVNATTGYMKLTDSNGNKVSEKTTTDDGLDITQYNVTYVTSKDEATKFITNSSGKIVINNLEIYSGVDTKYNYYVRELSNGNYGYNDINISNVTVEKGELVNTDKEINEVQVKLGQEAEITIVNIKNQLELGNLEILKVGEDGETLEGVRFKIERGTGSYLQLKDINGKKVDYSTGTVTINKNNKATTSEFTSVYVADINQATEFITDSNGIISIKNLEVSSNTSKYSYTVYETFNPNYGYGSKENVTLSKETISLESNNIVKVEKDNTIALGNLKLEKYQEDDSSLKLENVGFAVEISPTFEKSHTYLALYDKNGNIVPTIKGTSTINRKNIATDGEYKLSYYFTDKAISDLSEVEKANITIFETDNLGTLAINNLEVYIPNAGEKYTYKLIEVYNANYGFIANFQETGNVTLETDKIVNVQMPNKKVYTKISGYVWIENSSGKSNNYDGLYTQGNDSTDIKLTDLYIIKDGQLVKNSEAVTPVEIKLRNKTTGEFIKTLPDEFDNETGKYTFSDVIIDNLADYEVLFVYDGFYYTTLVEQLDKDNGSKVKEVSSERDALSNKFETVKEGSEVVSKDGTINTVEYYKDGHTSVLSELHFDTTVSASTMESGYNLKNKYDTLKEDINNINMGIVLREQPKISINSDIYSALIDFEGYKYNYKYDGRQNYYENKNGDDLGVKFEQENTTARYTRAVYASDIQAAKDLNKEIKLSVTYKIQVANESRTLSVMPKQLINYFDSRYDIVGVGLGLDSTTHDITNELVFSTPKDVEGNAEYKSTVIDFGQTISAGNSNVQTLYITFNVQREAILDLLTEKSTYHNATEILSYASYYGQGTSKIDGVQFMSEQTETGKVYAGIDKMSQPGNAEIKLVNHPSEEGTQILDTTNFEDDTTSAPSLLLEASEARTVSGTIFEDKATAESDANNEKLGDGIYNVGNESTIKGIVVELHKVNTDGSVGDITTYSDGSTPARTTTNENGEYTLGYYDETSRKYVGILPGRYVIKYIYNNESYIGGTKQVNVNDYKSTIITSDVIKNAISGNDEKWYVTEEANRYSDAIDNLAKREALEIENVKYSNYKDSTLPTYVMEALTPIMNIGLEFTREDIADALTLNFEKELKNVDFGIIERPKIDITIEKEITSLEIVSQTGASIVPKGNPSNPEELMQYVRTGLEGIVSAEIETDLLQSATLNLEYTITVQNNCEKDYLEDEYYFYGTGGNTIRTSEVKKVVDYLDTSMVIDLEHTEDGIWIEKSAQELYDDGLISKEVYDELLTGNYYILITEQFNELNPGETKSIKMYASKQLAVSDYIDEENSVEIIELSGGRTIKDSIPGNYNPTTNGPDEPDDDIDVFQVTPPTGTTVNYTVYIIAVAVTFIILVSGIVIIKKKIVK